MAGMRVRGARRGVRWRVQLVGCCVLSGSNHFYLVGGYSVEDVREEVRLDILAVVDAAGQRSAEAQNSQ